jgi:hypothetical protein
MSFDFAQVRWGHVVIGGIVGALVAVAGTILLQIAAGVVIGFQVRGNPPQEMMKAAIIGPPFQLVVALVILLGGYAGGRIAGRGAEKAGLLNGLLAGIVVALLAGIWRAVSWDVDITVIAHVILALGGGALGGLLAGRTHRDDMGYAA